MRLIPAIAACLIASTPLAAVASGSVPEIRQMVVDGRFGEALEVIERHLRDHPTDPEAMRLRGVMLYRQGRIGEAIEAFEALARTHPRLADSHGILAVLYAERGRAGHADAALTRAIDLRQGGGATPAPSPPPAKPGTGAEPVAPPPPTAGPTPGAAAAAITAAPPPAAAPTCYVVSGFPGAAEREAFAAWAGTHGFVVREPVVREGGQFLVHVPPLPDREAATRAIEHLRWLGISDIMRLNRGTLENGIALGVYGDESNAARRVASLQPHGYPVRYVPLGFPAGNRPLRLESATGRTIEPGALAASPGDSVPRLATCP